MHRCGGAILVAASLVVLGITGAAACPLEPAEPSCLKLSRPFTATEREDCRRQVERYIARNDRYRACLREEEQRAAERAQAALIRFECRSSGKARC